MKYLFYSCIFLLVFTACDKEENPADVRNLFFKCYNADVFGPIRPTDPTGLPESCKAILFDEKFNNNDNGWFEENNGNSQFDFYQNTYHSFVNEDKNWYLSHEIPLSFSGNPVYQVEADFKFVQITSDDPIYLTWGGANWQFFGFGITNDGKYSIIQNNTNTNATILTGPTSSPEIKTGGWNTLTVRKYNSKTYFFINGTLVAEKVLSDTWGDNVGFFIPSYAEMQIDNLQVHAWKF